MVESLDNISISEEITRPTECCRRSSVPCCSSYPYDSVSRIRQEAREVKIYISADDMVIGSRDAKRAAKSNYGTGEMG
ncbi:hypothetical protein ANN_27891 [Periplaneta americana]|uniref:Uncharacterized protein n=1 Tax=Periplaneta americana TaxID=6978 RepID=A0ABQ8RVI7_PERAM|nr:hypothetical protein ANN_27891 [Periplaneta americana]